jgi:predicted amidohydrolase
MITVGGYDFPETSEEAENWKRAIRVNALSSTVLVVATTRLERTWKAYCAAVPGVNHDNEWQAVLREGTMLLEPVARAIFPEFDDVPYAR